jgi:hypothetical protein
LPPEEAVGRYREALIRNAPPDELARLAADLDPETVATLRWMRESGRAARPTPDPLFAHRLERDLRRGFATSATEPLPFRGPPPPASRLPPSAAIPPSAFRLPPSASRPPGWLPLAVAAAVILVLAGVLLGYRQFTAERPQTVFVSTGEPRFETLIDATVENPGAALAPIAVERWRFQPDGTLSIDAIDGPQWIVAESGPFVATIDGAARTLAPGQGVVVPAGQGLELRNAGLSEATALRGVAAAGFSLEEHDRSLVAVETALDTDAHESLPPGRSRLVFDRLTLPAGSSITTEPATGQDWTGIVSGQLGLTLDGDTMPPGWTAGVERELGPDDPIPALVPGTNLTLRNLGEEPLVLLRLRVTRL